MLVQIGYADGKLSEWEDKYINTLSDRLGISAEEKVRIMEDPQKYTIKVPESYAQRLEFFYNLLFMMGIDNSISKEEEELCKQIGLKMCLNPMLMDDLIKIIAENIVKNVPADQVIQTVLKYQN